MLDKVTLEINLQHLTQNYLTLATFNQSTPAKLLAVVKSDAYGLGVDAIALHLAPTVYGFAVSTVSEALHLRHLGITNEIVVLTGWYDAWEYQECVKHTITLALVTIEQAEFFISHHTDYPLPQHLYIKADTGMSRLGLGISEISTYLPSCIDILGIDNIVLMSHFACSDDKTHPKNSQQVNSILELKEYYQLSHLSMNNSGGMIHHLVSDNYPRSGIALYGGWHHSRILPVATLIAPIIAIRSLKKGDTIGYSATYTCTQSTTIAIVGIGYSSGVMRAQTGTQVYVKEQYATILGVLSMEMTAIDITHLHHITLGDKVEIFGQHIPIANLAKQTGTISYELFTHLSSHIQRIYTNC